MGVTPHKPLLLRRLSHPYPLLLRHFTPQEPLLLHRFAPPITPTLVSFYPLGRPIYTSIYLHSLSDSLEITISVHEPDRFSPETTDACTTLAIACISFKNCTLQSYIILLL